MNQVITLPVEFELTMKPQAVMEALYKTLGARFVEPVAVPPKIGEIWPGQGGIYAGVARGRDGEPDYHLILCEEAPAEDFKWQAALEFAKTIVADGHKDFTVPTRWESALLYANLQDKLDTDYWHWTSTQSSEGGAFSQGFNYGTQDTTGKTYERRCRFVRRSVI